MNGEPTAEVQARILLVAFETMLHAQAVNGMLPDAEVCWMLNRAALNAPRTAVNLRRVRAALDPEVRAAVTRLAAAGDTSIAAQTIHPQRSEESRPDRLLGTPEAATLLGIQTQSVRIAIRRGALNGSKDESGWRVTRAEVERYRVSRARQAGH